MSKNLELKCFECEEKISFEVSDFEFDYYMASRLLPENSEAARKLFDGFGWVLQQHIYCETCKYSKSECYK